MVRSRIPLGVRLRRILTSEEAIYGLILVSGMIVISNSLVGTSANALLTVVVTVLVFFSAHVYAGTIARLAAAEGRGGLVASLVAALHHAEGMLVVAVLPVVVLSLGISHVFDDEAVIWAALILNTLMLGVLGWLAVSTWVTQFWPRLASALITAAFGAVIAALKAFIHDV